MRIPLFQVDAFTDKMFGGNPAAVCLLEHWLEDRMLQNIAAENNLAETAFVVHKSEHRYQIRWFTPEIEMDLCGHATLASAYVLFKEVNIEGNEILFLSNSGDLQVQNKGDYIEMDFPSRPPIQTELPSIIARGIGLAPIEVWKARDYLLVYDSEETVAQIEPNIAILNQINIDPGGIIITAESISTEVDFVSRFFTPQASVFEDPVTGSAHCTLVPFWANKLEKTAFKALQISPRCGTLHCELLGDRVKLRGKAIKYLAGHILLPNGNIRSVH